MITDRPYRAGRRPSGFTLLELLTATIMFSVILGALYSAFYGALRMREKAYEAFENGLPRAYVASLIRRDLLSLTPSGGVFSGPSIGERLEEGGNRQDYLEFFTASGVVDDRNPWGDIRKVEYRLDLPTEVSQRKQETTVNEDGKDLIRGVTHNLLPSEEESPEEECLLHGVRSLQFGYYDGEAWQDSWDGTTQTDRSVLAIGLRVDFQPAEGNEARSTPPICMVVPTAVKSVSTGSSSSEGAQGEPVSPPGSGPTGNEGETGGNPPP